MAEEINFFFDSALATRVRAHEEDKEKCSACGHEHKEDGSCDCGCA